MHRLWISLLSIVASSSAFRLPASPPPKPSSIDSDWSTKNKKQPGFLRLISAWYAMVSSYKTQIDVFASRPTTLIYQRSQVRVVTRPSPECNNARSVDPPTGRGLLLGHCGERRRDRPRVRPRCDAVARSALIWRPGRGPSDVESRCCDGMEAADCAPGSEPDTARHLR